MTSVPLALLAVLGSYLVGSVPSGLWLGLRFRGTDIRDHGSKNIGATNTMRVLGKRLGAIALLCDVAKGWVAVACISGLDNWPYLALACGLAAILGHTFSLFLKFRGGKGVATSTGVFLGLTLSPTLVAAVVFAIVVAVTRMVSAASVSAAAALIVGVFVFEVDMPTRIVAVVVALLVIIKHRSNLGRILKGEENRLGGG
jgi:glycerol-3-phosphate acyltransferase PlsY